MQVTHRCFVFYLYRDRIVTPVNVWANCTALVIIERYSHEELQSLDDAAKLHDVACTDVGATTNTVAIDIADEEEEKAKTTENEKDDALKA